VYPISTRRSEIENAVITFNPDQWHDFFVMVGGSAAALTGLVFVAMTLNLAAITRDATHRYRAVGTLTGFVAIFMACALALIGGQTNTAIGVEWVVVMTAATVVYVYGYLQARRSHGSSASLTPARLILGTVLYVAEVVGAAILAAGQGVGAYVAGVVMVALVGFVTSGAWLLIVGVRPEKTAGPGDQSS
jgi:hypothetical protein